MSTATDKFRCSKGGLTVLVLISHSQIEYLQIRQLISRYNAEDPAEEAVLSFHSALDIGTGSGYQAAVLAEIVNQVYSIEILCPLADAARQRLDDLGYENVHVRCGDGYRGWPEKAPFDVIIVAAAPDHVPQPLVEQLAPGGRLVIPVGDWSQELIVISKRPDGSTTRRRVTGVRFSRRSGRTVTFGIGRAMFRAIGLTQRRRSCASRGRASSD